MKQQHYQYDSLKNSNALQVGNCNADNEDDDSSCRVPLLILIPALLFTAFVAHIATVGSIGSKISNTNSNMAGEGGGSTIHTIKNDPTMAQAYAKKNFKKNLFDPSQKAEKFYGNSTNFNQQQNTDKTIPHPPKEDCTATIMIFRHCEAGVAREHCGYMGSIRSEYIATLFGNSAQDRWPVPDYIFAMSSGERHNEFVQNWREVETFQPLSDKVNVSINEKYGYPEKKEFVKHLYKMLRSGKMCGKLAVISWKHHDIPHLSHSLGCGPDSGCPMSYGEDDYEDVWQITYSYHKEKFAPFVVEDTTKHGLRKRESWGKYPEWYVYGTIQQEGFDPLEFAKDKANGSN